MDYKKHITIVEDWPKEGIQFKDITTLMDDGKAFKSAVDEIVEYAKKVGAELVVGPEARGFIVGCQSLTHLKLGLHP